MQTDALAASILQLRALWSQSSGVQDKPLAFGHFAEATTAPTTAPTTATPALSEGAGWGLPPSMPRVRTSGGRGGRSLQPADAILVQEAVAAHGAHGRLLNARAPEWWPAALAAAVESGDSAVGENGGEDALEALPTTTPAWHEQTSPFVTVQGQGQATPSGSAQERGPGQGDSVQAARQGKHGQEGAVGSEGTGGLEQGQEGAQPAQGQGQEQVEASEGLPPPGLAGSGAQGLGEGPQSPQTPQAGPPTLLLPGPARTMQVGCQRVLIIISSIWSLWSVQGGGGILEPHDVSVSDSAGGETRGRFQYAGGCILVIGRESRGAGCGEVRSA